MPVPLWVKQLLDRWLAESEITHGPLFRTLRKGGKLGPAEAVSEDLVYTLVRKAGTAIGHPDLTPHDLRRTCAKLCRKAGGELEQIQLLLGHASIQTTERYLGTKQDLVQAECLSLNPFVHTLRTSQTIAKITIMVPSTPNPA